MHKIKVAITGGIGSGKSTVAQYIKEMGYPVFSCDEIYKEIIKRDDYISAIRQEFPSAVINGKIERQILSEIVFLDPKKREQLNEIAHPLIMSTLYERMEKCEGALIFAEVPLLFEENLENQFDRTLVILREEEKRIDAVQKRDCLDDESIKKRIQAQFEYSSQEAKIRFKNCNAILLKNEGNIEKLHLKIKEIISNLLRL